MSDLRRAKETSVSTRKLIAREMSKEVEDRQSSSSNVVAKLMGLETDEPRSRSRSSSRCSLSSVDNLHHGEFEDGYEIWESMNLSRKGKFDGSMSSDKPLDLVRRNFMEAKRLVTDDKLHRSKEFQEALEVLSSNKDLFVKFLQESNSLFSQHLSEFRHVPPHPEATRITVLRPAKTVDAQKCVVQDSRSKQIKKSASSNQETGWIDAAQPTRIVVLKPSPGKALDIKAIASSSLPSYFDESGDAETRQVAKEITRQIRETFRGHCRNETLSSSSSSSSSGSSVLSKAYIGDDGSLNRSNNEYPVGNISNSETMSPSFRHSWDCANRIESPLASSLFSRASFSPESSVYREAKKRLSERWAMMSLNGDTQQQKNFPKASTALGDMLALSETKAKQESRRSISCIGSGLDQVESASDSLNTLERSKSVPEIRLSGGTSVSGTSRAQAHGELTESRSLKSSWKVSSFFFFRNKKAHKEKTDVLSKLAMPTDALQRQSIFTSKGEVTAPNENQDQPSPVSVLQQPFEEEYVGRSERSGSKKPWTSQGEEMSLKSSLIDKSPPIESIARVFSWEDESYITKPATGIKEEEDWYYLIKTLLKASGFRGSDPLMTRWHSPDCPLDPSLRDTFANKELVKRRKQRSNRKLVFDCVNAIITETTSAAAGAETSGFDMLEHVWTELKDLAVQDSNSLEGESVLRDEVVGKMWSRNSQAEVNNLGIEIEVMLLQELVQEAVFDLTR
ncbi:hypothetical protein EUTSA_v10001917mg [Eutrema salsugineum]|uniref:DUF4378 domain-containing protein n=1 Tax=Eutrema salsugineum TaxID=72664 RepID=V4M5W0_EUTSA|nr:uncharacterized protein LOC18025545 [Eutrema salsugineum]XP_024016060.1 uncharacterized protein LOC18025545 [Eutrema salsugineum]ESQ50392.1 hypothetical protein EUTSA_v10001917mg [Eutrema salsugineum]